MRQRILSLVAMGLLVCMPMAANNRNAGGFATPRGGAMMMPRGNAMGMNTRTVQTTPSGMMTRTHTVTNPAGSVTRTTTRSTAGTTRTMVNTEGNKNLTITHSKLAGSRPTHTRTFTHVRKTKTGHGRSTSHSRNG